ncbi:MAG: hypothetical protein ABJL57_11910 [Hyphomonas sp.]|jgi:threonine/homoserine efflux transporter RhtA|nr:hypothetical protein [Hyphomonadaceae bacterium]|tara:strand:- start:35184 stop:35468 length:285 start_codon:yes stop_codon:yes gene_type:complete
MSTGKRLRALKRALERAGLRLQIKTLVFRVLFRKWRAQMDLIIGDEMIRYGRETGHAGIVFAGHATCDRAMMILNEIETGERQAPRPASYWHDR